MIIIGNKPYKELELDDLIDYFEKNIRLNFGMAGYNNGTKNYIQYFNVHVYDNVIRHKLQNLDSKYKNFNISDGYLDNFIKNFKKENFINIFRQNNNHKELYNHFLKKNNCDFFFTKLPRLGCNALFDTLIKKHVNKIDEKIYIIGVSLDIDSNFKHIYNNKNTLSHCHNVLDEINIIKWLHENEYIDATFCGLVDNRIPTIDTNIIKPTSSALKILSDIYNCEVKII